MKKIFFFSGGCVFFLLSVIHMASAQCSGPPATPGSISIAGGSTKVCPGDTRTYSIANVATATSYNWSVPAGALINSGQGGNSISVSYNSGFTAVDSLRVIAINACGISLPRTVVINRNLPATPSVVSGKSTGVCPGTIENYSVSNINGITYNWPPPSGASVLSGQGTNSVAVSFSASFTSGNLQVTAANSCATSGLRNLAVFSVPTRPGAITGNTLVTPCLNEIYAIPPVAGATSYAWTVPSGSSIIAGADSAQIINAFGNTGGNITVRSVNACGVSPSRTLSVALGLNTPTGLIVSNGTSSSVEINWNPVAGASSYYLQYRLIGSALWQSGSTVTNNITISSLTPGVDYEVQVKAICNNIMSAFSSLTTFSIFSSAFCTIPIGLATDSITPLGANLRWDAVDSVQFYNVKFRIAGTGVWDTASAIANSLLLSSLIPATNYEWAVEAVCSFGQSGFSATASFTTPSFAPCSAPAGPTVSSITSSSATINWAPITDALSYNVLYRMIGESWFSVSSTTATVTLSGLTPAKTYECKIQTSCHSLVSSFTPPVSFTTTQSLSDSLITVNSAWKYLDNGSNQGTAWRGLSFNDSAWATGNAELGYGDGGESTVVSYGPNSNNKYITTYFRKKITISNPSLFSSLSLGIMRDDGAVVYINGNEVYRTNMPTGTVNYTTLASASINGANEAAFQNTTLSASVLVPGENVIAVELHQNAITSSDISFNLRLAATISSGIITIQRGPYLQMLTPNSIYIKWKTNIATNSRVRFGTDMSYGTTVDSSSNVLEHEVKISGLTPGTKYYYTIGSSAKDLQGDHRNFFKTSHPTGSSSPFRLWAIGDFGNNSSSQDAVRDAYAAYTANNPADLWIWLGDNAYGTGTEAEFTNNVFAKYPDIMKNTPLYPALGNHDYGSTGYQSVAALGTNFPYFNLFNCPTNAEAGGVASNTEKYYSYDYGNTHFIVLDSYGALNGPTSPMYAWLQSDLNANTQRWTVVYFHHPPYSMGTHNSNTEVELVNMRQNILPLLESKKVDLVLCGHSHVYERSFLLNGHYGLENTITNTMKVDASGGFAPYYQKSSPGFAGTVYAVVGCSGQGGAVAVKSSWPHAAMYSYANTLYGSMIVDFDNDTIHARFLTSTGLIYDQFKIVKSGSQRSYTQDNVGDAFFVFPNPFTNETTVRLYTNEFTAAFELYDVAGKLIYTKNNLHGENGIIEFMLGNKEFGSSTGFFLLKLKTSKKISVAKIERTEQ